MTTGTGGARFGRAIFALGALVLGGCGSDASPDSPGALAWRGCMSGFECATLDVPGDYANPDSKRQAIAVARARAGGPGRIGVLLYNLGGPGEIGVSALPAAYANLLPEVNDRFDLIAFDPRGIDHSSPPLRYLDDETIERMRALDPTPDGDSERAQADALADEVLASAARLDSAFASHVDTESVARDMDRLREALGEEFVSFYGGSYGTLLGATYATLFPDRVRAFVLDSSVMPALDREEMLRSQVEAYDQNFAAFLSWCEQTEWCALHALGDAEAIGNALDSLVESADASPVGVGERVARGSDILIAAVVQLNGGVREWPRLATMLDSALNGDASDALADADVYYGRGSNGAYDDDIVDANMAILSLDAPYGSRAEFDAFVEQDLLPASQRFGAVGAVNERLTVGWPFEKAHPLPTISAKAAPPVLILAGLHDPATPARWGSEMRDALGNGSSLVSYDGWAHGQLFASECIRAITVSFFVGPDAVPADFTCPSED